MEDLLSFTREKLQRKQKFKNKSHSVNEVWGYTTLTLNSVFCLLFRNEAYYCACVYIIVMLVRHSMCGVMLVKHGMCGVTLVNMGCAARGVVTRRDIVVAAAAQAASNGSTISRGGANKSPVR